MQKTYIVGITGGSGSGKTTFLKALADNFSKKELCMVSLDEYYRPKHEQIPDDQGIHNFDLPTSIDKDAFLTDIKQLLEGKQVQRSEYTFNNKEKQAKMLVFKPAPILIVEGLFIFHYSEIAALLDLKVFVHAKEDLKVIRRIKRDRLERNYPLDDVLYRYQHHVAPTFERYIRPYMESADVVINNNERFDEGLQVLIGFLKHKLQ